MAWTVHGNIRGPAGTQGPAGAQGPTGPAGPVGPAGLTWRGAWAAGTAYVTDDSVSQNGATWFATAGSTGVDPNPSGDGRTPQAPWALLAAEGAVGPTGPAGAQGPAGAAGPTGATGSTGPAGAQGPTGPAGAQGTRGTQWYTGTGAPGTIAGSQVGDMYLDTATGDTYQLA